MAQSGYTPIQLYYSSTGGNIPLAGNLANGELAINITDGKLFYKNNAGAVKLFANGATGGGVDQVFFQNGQTVTTNYTITTNFNAGTFGPVSIDTGITVTVPTGSVWTVV
jgi:hypothetical protein